MDGTNQSERVKTVFDEWALKGRSEGMERGHGPAARRAFARLGLREDSRYLDVGCGNGYTVRWAAEACPRGTALGIDVAPQMIARAQELSQGLSNASFRVAAFPCPELDDASFDAVFSMEAYYYFENLDAALRETCRILAPGGRFACVVDYYEENPDSHSWPEDVGVSMTLLSEEGWRAAFERAGFAVEDQQRLRLDPEAASAAWKADTGSLFTLGRRRA